MPSLFYCNLFSNSPTHTKLEQIARIDEYANNEYTQFYFENYCDDIRSRILTNTYKQGTQLMYK